MSGGLCYPGRLPVVTQVELVKTDDERIKVFESLGVSVGLQLISNIIVFIEGEDAGSDKDILRKLLPDCWN